VGLAVCFGSGAVRFSAVARSNKLMESITVDQRIAFRSDKTDRLSALIRRNSRSSFGAGSIAWPVVSSGVASGLGGGEGRLVSQAAKRS
jgi:hypothetical protein